MQINGDANPGQKAANLDALIKGLASQTEDLSEYASDLRMCHVATLHRTKKYLESKASVLNACCIGILLLSAAGFLRILGIYFR